MAMPDWLQVIYGFVLVVLMPFCAWIAAGVAKCKTDIAKLEVELEATKLAFATKMLEVDSKCKAEIEGRGQVRSSLGRVERNIAVIGSKLGLSDLETPS